MKRSAQAFPSGSPAKAGLDASGGPVFRDLKGFSQRWEERRESEAVIE
jgi:hypothetical protein